MHYYRLTKYNPNLRNTKGYYTKDEWTYYEQIGESFYDGVLTRKEYLKVEKDHVQCIHELLEISGIKKMRFAKLQKGKRLSFNRISLSTRKQYTLPELQKIIPGILRGLFWGQLVADRGYFLHFEWDYYIYLGLPSTKNNLEHIAQEFGLFLEKSRSPQLDEGT